ncbi:MAG: sodium:solute symporter family transporter, partial [Planctomycetota bacterium]
MLRRAILGLLISCAVILVLLLMLGFRPRHIADMLSHPVTGGTAAEGVTSDVAPEGPKHVPPRRSFGTANYAVLVIYLAAMLGIGVYTSRRIKGTRGFFIADGRMNHVVVGLSLLGTYLSALTMMGLPGAAYGKHDWTWTVQLPFLVVTAMVITGFVLPRYRKAGFISVYEYLEHRIDVSARVLASISFLVFSIARMGLVLYLPALAFHTVTGASLPVCVIGMGIVITAYTVLGGMEAVVWTDAIQVVIFIVGAVLTLAYIFADLGADEFVRTASAHNKFRLIIPSLDVTRITTVWLVVETLFQTIRIFGTQQDMVQRYMTTEDAEKANRSVWIAIIGYIPVGFIFYFIGTALFAFYKAHPAADLPGKADPMYPHFIVSHLPAGIAGLVIAAIFAAAMSSIDSLMNSSSTVFIEDLWKRFTKTARSDKAFLVRARMLTVLWGALAVVMGLLFRKIEYAVEVWLKVMGISTNGILALMALAFLPFRVN